MAKRKRNTDPWAYGFGPGDYDFNGIPDDEPVYDDIDLMAGIEDDWRTAGYGSAARSKPSASSLSYEDFVTEGVRYGLTQTEVQNLVPRGSFTNYDEAIATLESQAAPGYSQYVGRVNDWNLSRRQQKLQPMAPVAPSIWARYPEHLKQRRLQGEPVQYDRFNQPIVPEGHMYRKDSRFTYPTGVLQSSWLGEVGNRFLSTFQSSKLTKRIQMFGAHEQVFLSGRPTVTAPLKAGPGSQAPDRMQPLTGAYVIGGSPGPSGMMYMSRGVGDVGYRTTKDIYGPNLQPVSVGTTFERGQNVQLAEGLAGFKSRRWNYGVMDVAPISRVNQFGKEESGYRFLLQRSAPMSSIGFGAKSGASKALVAGWDLGGVTNASGNPMNLDFVGELKDLQGAAYEATQHDIWAAQQSGGAWHQARAMNTIARELGYSNYHQIPEDYASLGPRALQRMANQAGARVQEIHMPKILHTDALERYAATTISKTPWVNPRTGQADPDRWLTTQKYQALVGGYMKTFMDEPDVRRVTIGPEDLENLRSIRPNLAAELETESAPIRQSYRDVINAALVSGGSGRSLPTVSHEDEGFRSAVTSAYASAETKAREDLGLTEGAEVTDRQYMARKFVEEMAGGAYGGKFVDWGDNNVTAPFQSLLRFKAEGLMTGQETSKLLSGAYGMSMAALNREKKAFFQNRGNVMEQQRLIAESEQGMRRALGVTLPRDRMAGYKVLASEALAANQVYIPGMRKGDVGSVLRFPTSGESSFDPSLGAINIGRKMAKDLGLDPSRMYVSQELQETVSGDLDADIDYFLKTGQAMYRKGALWDTSTGRRLGTADILRMGQQRRTEGAASLDEELVGGQRDEAGNLIPPPTHEQAVQDIVGKALNPYEMSGDDIRGQVTEGTRLYGQIGPYYQNMRRMFSRAKTGVERRAVQTLWNLSHGKAQRPEDLDWDVQKLQDMNYTSPRYGRFFHKATGTSSKQVGLRNLDAIQWETSKAFTSLVNRGVFTPELAAATMAPEGEARQSVEAAFRESTNPSKVASRIREAINPLDWADRAVAGQTFGGQWARRTREEALKSGENQKAAFSARGIEDMDLANRLMGYDNEMENYLVAHRKGGNIETIADAVEASGMGSWLAPKPAPAEAAAEAAAPAPAGPAASGGNGAANPANPSSPSSAPAGTPKQQVNPSQGPAGFQNLQEAISYLKGQVGGKALNKYVSGGFGFDKGLAVSAVARRGASDEIVLGPNFFNPQGIAAGDVAQYQRRAMLHEFGHMLQSRPEFKGAYGQVSQMLGAGSIPINQAELQNAQQNAASAGAPLNLENEVFAEFTASALGERMQSPGFIDWANMDPAMRQSVENEILGGLGKMRQGKPSKSQATSPGGNGRKPPKGPAYNGPAEPPSDPNYIGQDEAGNGGGSNGGGGSRQTAGFGGMPWEKGGAWMGNTLRRKMDEAAENLGRWGKQIGDAIMATEDFNRSQRGFLKKFEGYRKAMDKTQDTIEQLTQRQASEEYKNASPEWQAALDKNLGRAKKARRKLENLPGYGRMLAASQYAAGIDEQDELLRAQGVNPDAEPFSWKGAIAGGLRGFTSGWELMRLQRMWNITGAPVFNQMIPAAAQAGATGWQGAMAMGGYEPGLPGGVAGGVMAYEASQRQALINAGRTGYAAWGWAQQPAGGLKQLQSILGPAAGAGLIGGTLLTSMGTMGLLGEGVAGMGATGIAASIGLPATAIIGGLAATAAGVSYAANQASPTAENALKIYRGEMSPGGQSSATINWQKAIASLGYAAQEAMGNAPVGNADVYTREQAERGRRLVTTQLSTLPAPDRSAVLSYTAQQLNKKTGTIWEGMDENQIIQALTQATPYANIGGMNAEALIGAGGTRLAQQIAATGKSPADYASLASSLGGGSALAAQLFQGMGALPVNIAAQRSTALEQYAGMMRFGYGPQDIYTNVMGRQATPGMPGMMSPGMAQAPQWNQLTGEQTVAMNMAYGAGNVFAQAYGVAPSSEKGQAFMDRMLNLAINNAQVQINNAQVASQYGGAVFQATGADRQQFFEGILNNGVSPAAVGIIAQQMTGGGDVGAALGQLPGMRSGVEQRFQALLAQGKMTPEQYQKVAAQAQFGKSQLGYSMLTGGIGGPMAEQLTSTFQQYLPDYMPAEGAQPLYEQANGGIYSYGTLEMRRLQHQQVAAQRQYQMGTGEWAYSGGYRMGMYGQLDRMQLNLANFQQVTGLQNQIFEAQHTSQQSNAAYAMASAEMQYRQGMENLALQQKMWQVNTAFQRQEMGIQYGQMQTQQQWGREDLAYQSEMAGLQYGWQMEDLDRGIRFATGRQKQQLMRQRERAEEMFTREEGRRGTEKERQETTYKWQDEKFSRERKHFEDIKALENQQFALQKQHMTEAFNLQIQHLQEQAGQAETVYNLEKQLRDTQTKKQEDDLNYQIATQENQIHYYEKVVFPSQEKEVKIREDMEDRYAKYLQKQVDDMSEKGELWNTWETFLNKIKAWVIEIQRMFGQEPTPPPPDPDPNDPPPAARGGSVHAGQAYRVGEQGEELFVPATDGSIVPHDRLMIGDALTGKFGRKGGVTVSAGQIVINVPPGNYGSPEELARAIKRALADNLEGQVNDLANRQRQRGEAW